jgi:hypothetical protein
MDLNMTGGPGGALRNAPFIMLMSLKTALRSVEKNTSYLYRFYYHCSELSVCLGSMLTANNRK